MEQVISVRLLGGDALGSYKVATVKTVAQLKCLEHLASKMRRCEVKDGLC